MILDLERFVAAGRPRWQRLEELLDKLESGSLPRSLASVETLHDLYRRAAADLARLDSFAAAPEVHGYLEAVVARAYAEIHAARSRVRGGRWLRHLLVGFPRAFRRRFPAFRLAVTATLLGVLFGVGAMAFDPGAKAVLIPFPHLMGDPSDRVQEEEARATGDEDDEAAYASFAAMLMTHNTRVGILALALGLTWGIGTLILLFFNGVILGAVGFDYVVAGEGVFLTGWLLPHGSTEIPAILIAGQAGLVLAQALIGEGSPLPVRQRLREATPDLVLLVAGFASLLVWAGLVESFVSQTHEPALPYALKIGFGAVELVLLAWWLGRAGREAPE